MAVARGAPKPETLRVYLYWSSTMKKARPEFQEQLATLVGSMGYELVGCEWLSQGLQTVLRIYIDSKNGVTVEGCSWVSRQISAMMDVEGPIEGSYSLEVSSPGIDRPLFEIEHYRRYIGRQAKIRLRLPLYQRKQFKGILLRVEGEEIYLLVEGFEQEVRIPFSAIEKGNLIGEVVFNSKKET